MRDRQFPHWMTGRGCGGSGSMLLFCLVAILIAACSGGGGGSTGAIECKAPIGEWRPCGDDKGMPKSLGSGDSFTITFRDGRVEPHIVVTKVPQTLDHYTTVSVQAQLTGTGSVDGYGSMSVFVHNPANSKLRRWSFPMPNSKMPTLKVGPTFWLSGSLSDPDLWMNIDTGKQYNADTLKAAMRSTSIVGVCFGNSTGRCHGLRVKGDAELKVTMKLE